MKILVHSKNYLFNVTHKEPKIQAEKICFSISSRRLAESVEGLINSLALLVGKL